MPAFLLRLQVLVRDQRGQGTVEYVGLILLVSLLMVGMVAAMKGFNGESGTEIAEVIVDEDQGGGERHHLPLARPARSRGRPPRPRREKRGGGRRAASRLWETQPVPRSYERTAADIRPVAIEAGFVRTATGSALYSQGETRIICTASVQRVGAALDGGQRARLGDR